MQWHSFYNNKKQNVLCANPQAIQLLYNIAHFVQTTKVGFPLLVLYSIAYS